MANATNSTPGDIQLAGDLGGNNDATAPELSTSGVTPGSYTSADITVNGKGIITAASNGDPAATIGDASSAAKGLCQFGTNITDDGSGVFSIATATNSVLGLAKSADTNHITITAGAIDVGPNVYTTDDFGDASAAATGIAQFGTNITDEGSGVFGVATATNSVLGLAKSADTDHITITAGAIDIGANIAKTDQENTFTAGQHTTVVTLTDAASISIDLSLGNVFEVTLGGNRTLSNPSNNAAGEYTIIVKQDPTGNRTLAYGSAYKFKNGATTTLSTGSNEIDILACVSDGTDMYCALAKDFE